MPGQANRELKEVWKNDFMVLFDDGTIGLSDGVGFLGEMDVSEVDEMCAAIQELKEKK